MNRKECKNPFKFFKRKELLIILNALEDWSWVLNPSDKEQDFIDKKEAYETRKLLNKAKKIWFENYKKTRK